MFRRLLTLLAVALTATTALPATARAGSSFKIFTDRAAYLAAVQAGGGTSRPQVTSGAGAVGTAEGGQLGDVYYNTSSVGAAFAPRTTGGVFDLSAGDTESGVFSFVGAAGPVIPIFPGGPAFPVFDAFGLGLSFTANTAGSFVATAANLPMSEQTATFDFKAGDSGFIGYVFDPDQQQLFQSIDLEVPTNGSATVTGIDFADAPSTVTPEPATFALVGAGVAAAGLAARRRRAAANA